MAEQGLFHLLDMRAVEEHVFLTYRQQMTADDTCSESYDPHYPTVVGFRLTRRIGRQYRDGHLFAVVEGAGVFGPISAGDPLHVGVRKVFASGQGPGHNRVIEDHYVTLFPHDLWSAASVSVEPVEHFFSTLEHLFGELPNRFVDGQLGVPGWV